MSERKCVLLVDDEPDISKTVVFRLKKAGYQIITAENGKTGLELARKERPDLILLDLRVPVMDGCEVCQRLKSDDNFKEIPVIFLTASMVDKITDKIKEFGAEDYIIKPFESEELLNKVKKYWINKRLGSEGSKRH
ncbi:MAG: PleD family two-component system response regulator [bacterium]